MWLKRHLERRAQGACVMPGPSETLQTIHRLKEEIDNLSAQQDEALKTATFLGMTTDEAKEYEQRRNLILQLVTDLEMLEKSA